MEYWKKVKDNENYKISSLGRVRKLVNNEWVDVKPTFGATDYTGAGYLNFTLNGKTARVHRMVAQAFIDNPLQKREVDHIDGDRFNNYVENLRWATRAENAKNAAERGSFKGFKSEDAEINFLTRSTLLISGYKIIQIAKMLKTDRSKISKMFNYDKEAKNKLFSARLFGFLFGDLMEKTKEKYHHQSMINPKGGHARKLSDENILEILKSRKTDKQLAEKYNVTWQTIHRHRKINRESSE
jgi:hypothetical protein